MVEGTACTCVIFIYSYTWHGGIHSCVGINRWKCVKASSQCVKIIVYLTGSLHDLLPLLDIVGQYFPNELIVIELFGEKSLVIFLNSVIKTKDKIKIAHLNIYQFKKKDILEFDKTQSLSI